MSKCEICKKEVPKQSKYQNFCSEECAARADYERKLEEIKKEKPKKRGLFKRKPKKETENKEPNTPEPEDIPESEPDTTLVTKEEAGSANPSVGVQQLVEGAKIEAAKQGVSPSTILLAYQNIDLGLISGRLKLTETAETDQEEEDL